MVNLAWSCHWHFLALSFRELIFEIGLTEKKLHKPNTQIPFSTESVQVYSRNLKDLNISL